jgi:hypothetical protein
MIFVHNGVTEVPRQGFPPCSATVLCLPWVRVYRAELPEHESHRGYIDTLEAIYGEGPNGPARPILNRFAEGQL